MLRFKLPSLITDMVAARNILRDHYQNEVDSLGGTAKLRFTFDGNLVGDIGEALAAILFDVKLVDTKSMRGIDGHAPNGKTVQVKATGTGRGPAFRNVDTRADHLLFFDLDFEACTGAIIFNGPEHYAVGRLATDFTGQRSLSAKQIRDADKEVCDHERLRVNSRIQLST